MIISTTPTLEGNPVRQYLGVVTGETIVGANIFKDFLAGISIGFNAFCQGKPQIEGVL